MNHKLKRLFLLASVMISGCNEEKQKNVIKFGTSAEYPPFEYHEGGVIKGFDIDLAHLIAQDLGKEAVFENMQFSTILAAVDNGFVDAGISTITITQDREKNFDLSDAYYAESLSAVFKDNKPIHTIGQLSGIKIACQLGSTMEIWLKSQVPPAEILSFDNNLQAIEALKAGHVEAVLVDGVQGASFVQKNKGLSHAIVGKSDTGYGVALKKGSPLKAQINQSIKKLISTGEIKKLEQKWLVVEK